MTAAVLPKVVADALGVAGLGVRDLDAAAVRAAANSRSPYSRFRVGAVVLDTDGTCTPGANIETASYGLTCCAERSALFAALGSGHHHPVAVSVACPDGNPAEAPTVTPCGACRQVIAELVHPDGIVSVVGVGTFGIDELLPHAFRL